jgi:hypothetical protein
LITAIVVEQIIEKAVSYVQGRMALHSGKNQSAFIAHKTPRAII